TQSRADGKLFLSYGRAREQQIRDVRTGYSQHKPDGYQQSDHRRPHRADLILLQRDDRSTESNIFVRVLVDQLLDDGAGFGLGLLNRDARLEPRHRAKGVPDAITATGW